MHYSSIVNLLDHLDKLFQQFPLLPRVSIISIIIVVGCYDFEENAFRKTFEILNYLIQERKDIIYKSSICQQASFYLMSLKAHPYPYKGSIHVQLQRNTVLYEIKSRIGF